MAEDVYRWLPVHKKRTCVHNMMTSSNGKCFPRHWPFVRGIHRYNGQWRGALMFPVICTNGGPNNRYAGNSRRHRAHYDVTVMIHEKWQTYPIMVLPDMVHGYIGHYHGCWYTGSLFRRQDISNHGIWVLLKCRMHVNSLSSMWKDLTMLRNRPNEIRFCVSSNNSARSWAMVEYMGHYAH